MCTAVCLTARDNKWKIRILAYFLTCSAILKGHIWGARKVCLLPYLLCNPQGSHASGQQERLAIGFFNL
jgi:hypothetical protein